MAYGSNLYNRRLNSDSQVSKDIYNALNLIDRGSAAQNTF